jgi:hypothetical protein
MLALVVTALFGASSPQDRGGNAAAKSDRRLISDALERSIQSPREDPGAS